MLFLSRLGFQSHCVECLTSSLLFFFFLTGSHYVTQAGLELLDSSDPTRGLSIPRPPYSASTTLFEIPTPSRHCRHIHS